MRLLRLAAALVIVLGLTASETTAGAQLTKPQYIAKANAICATAIADLKNLGGKLYPVQTAARVGDRWLAADRRALAKLRALSAPAGERGKILSMLQLADATINQGIAGVVKAAKSGSNGAYQAAALRALKLATKSTAAARAYGLAVCARWGT